MKFMIVSSALVSASLLASACATKRETGAATGAVGGAVVGGLIGGKTGALVGTFVGGALGYGVGRQMEMEDRRQMAYAMEMNRRMKWENAQTGGHYEVVPTRTYVSEGRECRQFRMLAEVDGEPNEVYGTACRNPDGSWDMSG